MRSHSIRLATILLFLALTNFSANVARTREHNEPVNEKDIFGHARRPCPCLLKKSIETEGQKKTEANYIYDGTGRLVKVQAKEGGALQTLGTISYTKEGNIASVDGPLNFFGIKFYYGEDNRLEKITYHRDGNPTLEMETVDFSYRGDTIVEARRKDNQMVGNESICTYLFDKDYNLIKATGVTKKNTEESIDGEITFEFHPGVYNYSLSGGDFRYFTLLLCQTTGFNEGSFFPSTTHLVKRQNFIDYNGDKIRSERIAFDVVVNAKNKFNFPTSISYLHKDGQPNTSTELTYECK